MRGSFNILRKGEADAALLGGAGWGTEGFDCGEDADEFLDEVPVGVDKLHNLGRRVWELISINALVQYKHAFLHLPVTSVSVIGCGIGGLAEVHEGVREVLTVVRGVFEGDIGAPVRDSDDEFRAGLGHAPDLLHEREGIGQVLKHMRHEDAGEEVLVEGERLADIMHDISAYIGRDIEVEPLRARHVVLAAADVEGSRGEVDHGWLLKGEAVDVLEQAGEQDEKEEEQKGDEYAFWNLAIAGVVDHDSSIESAPAWNLASEYISAWRVWKSSLA
jgi:hypothetical protein